jgi:hypothetical protein
MLNNFTRILQKNFWKNQKNKGAALWPKNQYFRDISAGLSPSAEMMNFLNNKSYVIYKNMRFSDHVNLKNKKSKILATALPVQGAKKASFVSISYTLHTFNFQISAPFSKFWKIHNFW